LVRNRERGSRKKEGKHLVIYIRRQKKRKKKKKEKNTVVLFTASINACPAPRRFNVGFSVLVPARLYMAGSPKNSAFLQWLPANRAAVDSSLSVLLLGRKIHEV
jgi:hypothetical protein